MKTLFVLLMMSISAFALPNLTVDGVTVPSNDPRIGQHVFVEPLSVWRVYGNDNVPGSLRDDRDYDDGVVDIFFNMDGSGKAVWVTGVSSLKNYWVIGGGIVGSNFNDAVWGPLELGQKLPVYFMTGDGHKFPSGHVNVMAERISGPEVPEPSTTFMLVVGFGMIGLALKRKS